MPTLTNIHGKSWPDPDAASVQAALEQLKNASADDTSATLKLDTGQYVTIHSNRTAAFGDGVNFPRRLEFSSWDQLSKLWLQLFQGDIAAVRDAFFPTAPAVPMPEPSCVKCGVVMNIGFIPAAWSHYAGGVSSAQLVWYSGQPQTGFLGAPKLPQGESYLATAYRCPKCGRLEWYARQGT